MLLRGIQFVPLDIRTSHPLKFLPAGPGFVAVPLLAVAGLGEAAAKSIAKARKHAQFLAVDQVLSRCRFVSRSNIASLRETGAFDGLPESAQVSLF